MYRLIVADDEPWVAYRLSHLVDYPALGFEVIATALDGETALTLCQQHQADVLLTDIRMPGLDGLELLHALRENQLDTEVVLISGYAEFAYAQSAIRDGAFDYLVKQISAQQLEDVLRRLKMHLDRQRESYSAAQDLDALLSLFSEEGVTVSQWLDRYYQPDPQPWVCLGLFSAPPPNAHVSLRTGKDLYTAIISCPERKIPAALLAVDGCHGFSAVASVDEAIGQLHKQSSIAHLTTLFMQQTKARVYQAPSMNESTRLLQELETSLKDQDQIRSLSLLTLLEQQARELNIAQITQIYNKLCTLFSRYRSADVFVEEELDYRLLVQSFSNLAEMFSYFSSSFDMPSVSDDSDFEQILQFIDRNYTQDLRSSDLAAQFHFSSSYFSTLFHKQVGMTFTKYMTHKRINLAKELLCNHRLSLQEIAEKSGYSDYFQFNKTFKKYTGMAPGQYRQTLALPE